MQYVVILEIDDSLLDGDESVEVACYEANRRISQHGFVSRLLSSHYDEIRVRPLSEVIAC